MTALPQLSPTTTFDEACAAVIGFLKTAIPMGFWGVNRVAEGRQLYLTLSDDAYGQVAGDANEWTDGFCQFMIAGGARIVPDVDGTIYATAPVRQIAPIQAYVGMPISRSDGQLFGTLCGLDPAAQAEQIRDHEPLLQLLSELLAITLEADTARVEAARQSEQLALEAITDPLTNLFNRRAWDRYLEFEEARARRFGDPGSIIIVDLDGVKQINDEQGHNAGDDYIKLASKTLRNTLRESDIIARLGGDEFGIVVARTPVDAVAVLVNRLRCELDLAGVAASLGHSPHTHTGGFVAAWESADLFMYADKTRRRAESTSVTERGVADTAIAGTAVPVVAALEPRTPELMTVD